MPFHVMKNVSFFNTTNELYWRACDFRSNITNFFNETQLPVICAFYHRECVQAWMPFHVKKTVSFFNTTNELYWRACDFRSNITNVWTQRQLPFICGFYYCA